MDGASVDSRVVEFGLDRTVLLLASRTICDNDINSLRNRARSQGL